MSSRQTNTSTNDDLTPGETSSGNRISPSSQRNSRRSNSAMSASRTRGSASKEEADAEGPAGEENAEGKDIVITAEPEDDGDANENVDSGDSVISTAPAPGSRGRRKAGGKKRRGGAGGPGSRTRTTRESKQANNEDYQGEEEEEGEEEEGAEDEEAVVKIEAGEDKQEDGSAMLKSTSDYGEDSMSRTTSKEGTRLTRQRSASGFKELAGLGLRSLGNGEEEPLVPRRTRRGAYSPNEASVPNVEEDEKRSGDALAEEDSKAGEEEASAKLEPPAEEGQEASADDETAEEGVTRCLCGSADENVGLMIQCETCKCWQHCICMGMRTEEDCPDVYFCEQCRPELHIDLLRLLGVLPAARSGKKIGGGKTQSGRISAKDAAKELKEAKEAVLSLAKENERRRKEGRDPVTGWSVAQEQEQEQLHMQQLQMQQGTNRSSSSGQHRRQPSETQMRASRSQSRDELSVPKSPPKRRSTMNSRDSAYGWESIPPGLLNEEEDVTSREDGEGGTRKRKRGGQGEDGERHSPSPVDPSSNDGTSKRRRTSSAMDGNDEEETQEAAEEDDAQAEDSALSSSQAGRKGGVAKLRGRDQEAGRPKHPNQYTARRAAAAAAAASATHGGGGAPGSSSPSPSPSKHRWADEMRKGSSLRDVINNGSRIGTPTPGGSQGDFGKASNPGAAWGMPEHLSHLAYLLPTSTGPEPLNVSVASTKGLVTTSNAKGASSTAVKDSNTRRIIQASPQAFQVHSLVEANTKIKFPGKRTTFGEMKKRVRNILDFVSRLQVESAERERRMKFLGISKDADEGNNDEAAAAAEKSGGSSSDTPMEESSNNASGVEVQTAESDPPTTTAEGDQQDTEMKTEEAAEGEGREGEEEQEEKEKGAAASAAAPGATPSGAQPSTPADNSSTDTTTAGPANGADTNTLKCFTELHSSSMSLVDELTRELLAFLQRYGSGTSTSVPMASSGSAY